ncbi:ArsA family ATPase [Desulforhopalus vacuolatus]|uniref:ArsA family ATPase n=1 Tax=Desulforhopalus vacuolatus TaxID=40414 RepID=UPI0019666C32|nr:ArsA family ATPase [Desulforhopalus vacuolatus]MBM9521173.1 ArsA family ATPase [Desulforhopalus vacuolatus]
MTSPFFCNSQFRLLFFGGKGGVGKTTCATATAVNLANKYPQKSVLLASSDPAHSLIDCLGEYSPPDNVTVLEMDAQKCLVDFKEKYSERLREIASRGTFLDDDDISSFLALSLPGLDELMAFLEISKWIEENRYDCIVMDTAPTGHTLRLLAMPGLIKKWLAALDAMLAKHRYMKQLFKGTYQQDALDEFLLGISRSVQQLEMLLSDTVRCRFVPVMLAETLSGNETKRLLKELHHAKIPISDIVVNNLYPDDNGCPVCSDKRMQQNRMLEGFVKSLSAISLWGIPQSPIEIRGKEPLESFWEKVFTLDIPQSSSAKLPSYRPPLVANAGNPPGPEIEFLFFAGKGGVGKTTLACATALRMAQDFPDKNILIFSTDPAHSLADCLDIKIGGKLTEVAEGLTALEINAEEEFKALKNQYAKELEELFNRVSSHVDVAFDREVMERVLDLAPPGLDEVMALTRIMELHEEGKYDIFVFDSAPTGHFLKLLESPEMITQWLKAFFALFLKYKQIFKLPDFSQRLVQISKDLKKMRTLLQTEARTNVYAVSILTEMAFCETKDLIAACEVQLGIQVPVCFLNLVTPAGDCPFCNARSRQEEEIRKAFKRTFASKQQPIIYRQAEPRGVTQLTALGAALYLPYEEAKKSSVN